MELTKEVRIEIIAELLKKIVERIADGTGLSPGVMLPMMKTINNSDDMTMDQVYHMAAEGFYNKLYGTGYIISWPNDATEDLPNLTHKGICSIIKRKEDKING